MKNTQQEIIQNMRNDILSRSYLQIETLTTLRKHFDELKSNAQNNQTKPNEMPNFKQKAIDLLLQSLSFHTIALDTPQEIQKSKMSILEILQRDFVSTKYNVALFTKLFQILQKDNQNIAIQASKALDTLIKQVNDGTTNLLDKSHYIKLFQYLKQKTEFLLRLSDYTKQPEFNRYKRTHSVEEREKPPLPNSKSLKFLNQVPNLFVHLMAYVDIWRNETCQETKVKQLIRESISNIIQALRKIPYQQFYDVMTQDFNSQLFGVMTKLLQFLFILLKSEKDDKRETNNKYLKHHISDQVEYIKVHEVLMNYIYLLKNCPDDFQISRYEIVNRLKLLMNNLSDTRLKKQETVQIIKEILNEDVIFGKNKFLGEYSKNAICNFWVDIIRSPILLYHMFPPILTSLKNITGNQDQLNVEFQNHFSQVQKLFESTLKTIFDNSLYLSVQERSLQMLSLLVQKLFNKGNDIQNANTLQSNTNPQIRKFHQMKLNLITKVLNAVALKFGTTKNVFNQISAYVFQKTGFKPTGKKQPNTQQKMEHIQLHTLPIKTQDQEKWDDQRTDFIQNSSSQIDSSLLTLSSVQNKFLMIYQQQEELAFNSHPVKMSNYYNYMKEVKTKIIEKCIILATRITQIFINQNLIQHGPNQNNLMKSVYYYTPTRKLLSEDQCQILGKLLKNGLKVFQTLHDYDFHSEEHNKKGHLKTFMLIFAQIYDPINFRDIFEPNMDLFFKHLLKYAKHCSDYCLQWVLIEPFCSNSQVVQFNKNIVQLLIYNLIIKLEYSSDQLDPFHQFYEYKDEYFSLLQKLIRFPFRCLSRYSDDSFIRNYFRQIVLFLIKKAHTSRFCLDYLHLMRTLFKNILYNSNRENTSPLFNQFYSICSKNGANNLQPTVYSNYINVNVLENFHKLFETGIPQLADIVTQLIIMLPLKSKHIIQYAKLGYIVKPLLHCLCMMADYNYTLRTIKTFEIIISHSTAQEISGFLDGIKEKLINRLLQIVSESKINELKPQKMPQDLSSLSLKLLAKLGALPRLHLQKINMESKYQKKNYEEQIQFVYTELKTHKKFKVSMVSCIQYCIQIFEKLLDQYYQSHVLVSVEVIETAFNVLRQTLPLTLQKLHPISERLIKVFSCLLSLHSKYITISPNLLSRIRQGVKDQIKKIHENASNELCLYGLTNYSKLFIKCLIINLSQRVLITREDHCINQIAQQPKAFLWSLLQGMLNKLNPANKKSQHQIYTYVIQLLLSQCVMISNNEEGNSIQGENKFNYILPYKHAALSVLHELIDKTPQKVLFDLSLNIIETLFITASTIPEILNLKISQYPVIIGNKMFKLLLKNESILHHQHWEEIFSRVLQNLLSYSSEAHKIAMNFLTMLMNIQSINVIQLLYGGKNWSQIQDRSCEYTYTQSKYHLSYIRENFKTCPLTQLIKKTERTLHNINEDSIKQNQKNIKLMTNAFRTIQWLISIKHKGKTYQAFTLIKKGENSLKQEENDDFSQKYLTFHAQFIKLITIALEIIAINESLFSAYVKIILQTNQTNAPTNTTGANSTMPTPLSGRPPVTNPLGRVRDPPPASQPNNATQHTINQNTYFDDEEYRLNIEDIDIEIKTWGQLISAIIRFLKTTLLNDNIFQIVKINLKKKNEKSAILENRSKIIFILFNLVARVDRTVRSTAYKSLKELLSKQQHPKQLLSNDEKLKNILRPVLICLQHDFKKFTPSFLYIFKKILKLLTQCFNNALIQKLLNHLSQIQKAKQNELANPLAKVMNYCQLMHEAKCISSLLGLFQYLSFAYQSTTPKYTINSVQQIINHTGTISKYFIPKLGKQSIMLMMKKNLAKLVNTMSPWFTAEIIFNQPKKLYLQMILQIIKMDQSYAIRQKIIREPNFADKMLEQSQKMPFPDYLIILQIIKALGKRNSRWLRKNGNLSHRIIQKLQKAIQAKFRENEKQQFHIKNEIKILVKILLIYARENKEQINVLFIIAKVFRIRSTCDFNFLRIFFKYELYDSYDIKIKKQIFLHFVEMMKTASQHIQTKIVCSYNIIYPMLMKASQKNQTKLLINEQDNTMGSFIQLMKHSLNLRQLQNRSSNNYRVGIEVLQLSSFIISSLKNELAQYKRQLLGIIWALLKVQDKMLKNYAFICTSNFIRIFDISENNKVLSIYLTLLKGLETLTQYDYEVGALNKKALNILIPYWSERRQDSETQQYTWINWTLRMLHQQSNEPFRLVRFWEIVVKNHQIFQKFKQSKFQTQMINSMQWLMVTSNPSSQNPLVKKIASDLSFIYIQWKYKDTKLKLEEKQHECRSSTITYSEEDIKKQKKKILQESMNQKAAEICLNFFMKVAFYNSMDKEDKEIMRRSLYLLKKMLILWPNTKKKFDQIKNVVQKLKTLPNNLAPQPPLRFHYTLLNIINILLQFQSDNQIAGQLNAIFKLFELGQLPSSVSRAGTVPQQTNSGLTLYTVNNPYLLYLICNIMKRLIRVAYQRKQQQQSQIFLRQINQYVRQGLDSYVMTYNKTRSNPQQQIRPQTRNILKIEIVIAFVKILFEFDQNSLATCLNNLKQVASIFKKVFQTRSASNRGTQYVLNPLQGTFKQMLGKQSIISIELFTNEMLLNADENYERQLLTTYNCRRLFLVIVIRILATKFNNFHVEDRNNILELFTSIHEKLPDPDLKMEIINLLKCMFIGSEAFTDNKIPERYEKIKVINLTDFPINKIFFLLFEDNTKFFEHFERRKIKPNDQTYNVSQKIYQQILTRSYFDFLCLFIKKYSFNQNQYLEKIKIFALYACKVSDPFYLDNVLDLIEKSYGQDISIIYTLLFQDFKQLNCAQEYLQGDQIMLFFTRFLLRLAVRNRTVSLESFGIQKINKQFYQYYELLLKSDQISVYYNTLITKAFTTAIQLLPKWQKLPIVITHFLMKANLSHTWGLALLKIAISYKSLAPEQLYIICSKIGEWGLLQKQLEESQDQESANWVFDELYKNYGDKDILYGFRMNIVKNSILKNAYTQLQQRQYYRTLTLVNKYKQFELQQNNKRPHDQSFIVEVQSALSLSKIVQKTYASQMMKQCYKNLNQWDLIHDVGKTTHDVQSKVDLLFMHREDKEKIKNIVSEFELLKYTTLPYYYGKSLLHFLTQPHTIQRNSSKQINVSILYALIQWLSLPKNAKHKQNEILVKTQCLLQLQQGYKIKQESVPINTADQSNANYQALTKVVQSIFNEINTWRQRIPHKFENLSIWRTVFDQRNVIFIHLKKKMQSLLEAMMSYNNINESSNKLLIPYTDIEWNNLKLIKQQRIFGIFSIEKYNIKDDMLYYDEVFLKNKQLFYYYSNCRSDYEKAGYIVNQAMINTQEPLFKMQYARLKSKLLCASHMYKEASNILAQSTKNSEQQIYILWKEWQTISYKAYTKNMNPIECLKNAISVLPYSLRYQPNKSRLQLVEIFRMISENIESTQAANVFASVMQELPVWTFLIWVPQIISLINNPKCAYANSLTNLLQKLGVYYPQSIFYSFKQYKIAQQKNLKQIYIKIRKTHYNLISKLQNMVTLLTSLPTNSQNKIPITHIGNFSRCFSQIHIPSFETTSRKSDSQVSKIPSILQISQNVEMDTRNNKTAKLITLLGSDSKQYLFRIEKRPSTIQTILSSQFLDILNNHLESSRESFIRKLKLNQVKKLFINEQSCLISSSAYTVSLLDILNQYMSKTSFGLEYPENDKSYARLPKSQVYKVINKRMKEIVPQNVLKQYFIGKSKSLDDYYLFRKEFSYSYSTIQLVLYMVGNQSLLSDYIVHLPTANIYLDNFKIKTEITSKANPFSIRLSRNIKHFITKTMINGAILPGMIATCSSFANPKLHLQVYLSVMSTQLAKTVRPNDAQKYARQIYSQYIARINELLGQNNDQYTAQEPFPNKSRILLETAEKIGVMDNIPINLKYWF